MASISAILRALSAIPRGIERAMVDEEPILRERIRRDTLSIPGIGGAPGGTSGFAGPVAGEAGLDHRSIVNPVLPPEPTLSTIDTPTGEVEQIGSRRRPSRLANAIGGFADNFVTAMNAPVRGNAVGTIGQFTNAVGAIRNERERRDMRDRGIERQDRMDDERSQLHQAQMDQYASNAERNRAMAAKYEAFSSKDSIADQFDEFMRVAMENGLTRPQAIAAWSKQVNLADKPVTPANTVEGVFARWVQANPDASPEEIAAKREELKLNATAKRGNPFINPRPFQTKDGAIFAMPKVLPEGGLGVDKVELPFTRPEPQRAPVKPAGPRQPTQPQARQQKISGIASRLLSQNQGDAAAAMKAASTDPEAAPFLVEITSMLRRTAPSGRQQGAAAPTTGGLAGAYREKAGAGKKPEGSGPIRWGRDAQGKPIRLQ